MAQRLQLTVSEIQKRIAPISPDIIEVDETNDTRFTAFWIGIDDLRDLDYTLMYYSEDIEIIEGVYNVEDMPELTAIDFSIVDVDFEGGDHPDVRSYLW